MKLHLLRNGQHLLSTIYSFLTLLREAREAKRGGTAPGEQRVHKQGNYDLNKVYAVNPRIQKINIASPNIKNISNSTLQNETLTIQKSKNQESGGL